MVDFITPLSSTTRYKWTLHSPNPCPACRALSGQRRTYEQWAMAGGPSLHKHCRCSLDPVEEVENQHRTYGDAWYLQFSYLLYWNVDGTLTTTPNDNGPAILDPHPPNYDM